MAIDIKCGQCGKSYRVDDALAGRAVRCRACQAAIHVHGDDRDKSKSQGLRAPEAGAMGVAGGLDLSDLSLLEQSAAPPALQHVASPPAWKRWFTGGGEAKPGAGGEAVAGAARQATTAVGRSGFKVSIHWALQALVGLIICLVAGFVLWGMFHVAFLGQTPGGDATGERISARKITLWIIVFGFGLKLIFTRPDPNAGPSWLFRGWLPRRGTVIFMTIVSAGVVIAAAAHTFAAYFAWLGAFLLGAAALALSLLAFVGAALTMDVGDFPKRSAVVGLWLVALSFLAPVVYNTMGAGQGGDLMTLPESPADQARRLRREARAAQSTPTKDNAANGSSTPTAPPARIDEPAALQPATPQTLTTDAPRIKQPGGTAAPGGQPWSPHNAPPPHLIDPSRIEREPPQVGPTRATIEDVLLPMSAELAELDRTHERLRALHVALRAWADRAGDVYPASLDDVAAPLADSLGDEAGAWLARIEYLPDERADGYWQRIVAIDPGPSQGAGVFHHERAMYLTVSGHVWSITGHDRLQARVARQRAKPAAPAPATRPMRWNDANHTAEIGNAQRLAVALMDYARDHVGRFPPSLQALSDAGYVPADTSIAPPELSTVHYIPGLNIHYPPAHVIVYNDRTGFGAGMGQHIWDPLGRDSVLDRQRERREKAMALAPSP